MNYKPLSIYKRQNNASSTEVFEEYKKRLNSYATFRTDLEPYLMDKDTLSSKTFPIFIFGLPDITLATERIKSNSNYIKQIANSLPPVATKQFFLETLTNEIKSTNDIEGVHSSKEEISFAIKQTTKRDKVRLGSTVRMYMDIMEKNHPQIKTLDDIRDLYDHLLEKEISESDKIDGKFFRKHAVHIESYNQDKVVHYAPTGEQKVENLMHKWIEFINNSDYPMLVKATIGHYFFENIHPFYDGNGRTGRYILSIYLSRKLDIYTGMSISQAVQSHKTQYYKAFNITGDANNFSEGTFFVMEMLDLIENSQYTIIDSLKSRADKFKKVLTKINDDFNRKTPENYVLFLLTQSKLFSSQHNGLTDREILDMAKDTKYSVRKIKSAISDLVERKILIQIKGRPLQHELTDDYIS
ncbi:Fic family protein [Fructobacillus fructosus]|uniref:Fic family protein n=1 Tax=Fructobacillus fructosus TaxID=1631 RepID=UPI002DAA6EB2|nr:Fic family protein [Fructobacillus fructosus]CAK1222881.1 Fic family protein [Fructobacillus fructosus]